MSEPEPPVEVVTDPVSSRLLQILGCVQEQLDRYHVPTCRSFVHPGSAAPWDACGDLTADGVSEGQSWVTVPTRLYPVNPFPTEDSGAQRCRPVEFAADVIVGILRCTPVVDDQAQAPSASAVTESAFKTTRDAAILREALLCCYLDDDADPGIFRLGSWEPLGPTGGCAGGQWRATVRVPACPCPPALSSG